MFAPNDGDGCELQIKCLNLCEYSRRRHLVQSIYYYNPEINKKAKLQASLLRHSIKTRGYEGQAMTNFQIQIIDLSKYKKTQKPAEAGLCETFILEVSHILHTGLLYHVGLTSAMTSYPHFFAPPYGRSYEVQALLPYLFYSRFNLSF